MSNRFRYKEQFEFIWDLIVINDEIIRYTELLDEKLPKFIIKISFTDYIDQVNKYIEVILERLSEISTIIDDKQRQDCVDRITYELKNDHDCFRFFLKDSSATGAKFIDVRHKSGTKFYILLEKDDNSDMITLFVRKIIQRSRKILSFTKDYDRQEHVNELIDMVRCDTDDDYIVNFKPGEIDGEELLVFMDVLSEKDYEIMAIIDDDERQEFVDKLINEERAKIRNNFFESEEDSNDFDNEEDEYDEDDEDYEDEEDYEDLEDDEDDYDFDNEEDFDDSNHSDPSDGYDDEEDFDDSNHSDPSDGYDDEWGYYNIHGEFPDWKKK